MKVFAMFLLFCIGCCQVFAQYEKQYASGTETVYPIHKNNFRSDTCTQKKQGGNPRKLNGYLVFNGCMDGNRQVDPQVAVGGGYVLHGTNTGLYIYDKKGGFVQGVSQKCFNNGIDPKLLFDIHNRVFAFDMWWYYDKEKNKPVNIAVSETSDPTGAWNIYPVSRKEEVDGGAIGYSKKWIGYSYPGGDENTFVLRTADAIAGKPATIYHFKGSLGNPLFVQDNTDDLYFFSVDEKEFIIRKITGDSNGIPCSVIVARAQHGLDFIDYPPASSQKGTDVKVASGDRNPKNIVLQNGSIWFSQAVSYKGHSAVQWHQVNAISGKILQTGLLSSDTANYIQTTIGVNKKNDVLIGFQEVSGHSFVSPRFAYRRHNDKPGTVRKIISAGEGKGATEGGSWGDYSGTIIDGDNHTDIWTVQSIANEKGKGETVIVKVPFKK